MPRARSLERGVGVSPPNGLPDHRKFFSASHDDRSADFSPETRERSGTDTVMSPDNYSFLSMFDGLQRQPGPSVSRSSLGSQQGMNAATQPDGERKLLAEDVFAQGEEDLPMPEVSIVKVLGKIWYHALVVFGVFAVSLFIFPGFLTVTCGKGPFSKISDSWYRLILVTMFNCADLAGRVIAPFLIALIPNSSLWGVAIFRIGLVPLFYGFVYNTLSWWWGPLFFTLLLGVSNGFFGSICMMHGPSQVEAHEREMAGTLMAFCLMMGIIIGAALQLGVAQVFAADGVGKCS